MKLQTQCQMQKNRETLIFIFKIQMLKQDPLFQRNKNADPELLIRPDAARNFRRHWPRLPLLAAG